MHSRETKRFNVKNYLFEREGDLLFYKQEGKSAKVVLALMSGAFGRFKLLMHLDLMTPLSPYVETGYPKSLIRQIKKFIGNETQSFDNYHELDKHLDHLEEMDEDLFTKFESYNELRAHIREVLASDKMACEESEEPLEADHLKDVVNDIFGNIDDLYIIKEKTELNIIKSGIDSFGKKYAVVCKWGVDFLNNATAEEKRESIKSSLRTFEKETSYPLFKSNQTAEVRGLLID